MSYVHFHVVHITEWLYYLSRQTMNMNCDLKAGSIYDQKIQTGLIEMRLSESHILTLVCSIQEK